MEAVNHEYYVSLEVAKLLKEAGFDWEVQSYYSKLSKKQGSLLWLPCGCNYKENINTNQNRYSAPTLDVAQRWLREVKEIHVYVISYRQNNQDKISGYCYKVYEFTQGWEFNCFSYEEAQEKGIKKALEIILKKVK